jgi:hypothetical protein
LRPPEPAHEASYARTEATALVESHDVTCERARRIEVGVGGFQYRYAVAGTARVQHRAGGEALPNRVQRVIGAVGPHAISRSRGELVQELERAGHGSRKQSREMRLTPRRAHADDRRLRERERDGSMRRHEHVGGQEYVRRRCRPNAGEQRRELGFRGRKLQALA